MKPGELSLCRNRQAEDFGGLYPFPRSSRRFAAIGKGFTIHGKTPFMVGYGLAWKDSVCLHLFGRSAGVSQLVFLWFPLTTRGTLEPV